MIKVYVITNDLNIAKQSHTMICEEDMAKGD
jgi:hypothetical protein